MKTGLRLLVAVILLIVSLPLLVWGFWPPRRETRVVPMIPAGGEGSLEEARTIRLEYAPVIRAGESEVVRLWLEPGVAYQASPLYEAYTVVAEARLDLSFAHVRPEDVIRTPLPAGDTAAFYWEVTPHQAGTLRGMAWLYLRFVPKAGGAERRVTVSAQEVEVRSVTFLGRSGSEARVVGVVGVLFPLLLGFPFLRLRRAG